MNALALARACLQAYVDKDRAAAERLIGDDFTFTRPLDNRLSRETYFSRCWPNSQGMPTVNIVEAADEGDRAFIVYEAETDSKRLRNCGLHTAQDGKLVSVEVYFGWDLPHAAAPGRLANS